MRVFLIIKSKTRIHLDRRLILMNDVLETRMICLLYSGRPVQFDEDWTIFRDEDFADSVL